MHHRAPEIEAKQSKPTVFLKLYYLIYRRKTSQFRKPHVSQITLQGAKTASVLLSNPLVHMVQLAQDSSLRGARCRSQAVLSPVRELTDEQSPLCENCASQS